MNHLVVNDTCNFGLVGPGRIRVKNNLPVLKKFGPKSLPLGAPDCSEFWGSLHSEFRLQPGEYERFRAASLDYSHPLFPHGSGFVVHHQVLEVHILGNIPSVKCSFVLACVFAERLRPSSNYV